MGLARLDRGGVGSRVAAFATVALAALAVAACADEKARLAGHLENAHELLAEGKQQEAILELHSALHLSPDDPDANNTLAEIELRNGRYEVAIEHIQTAYRVAPDDERSALNLARMLVLQVEDLDRAEQLVDGVLERDPKSAAAYIVRSNLALARGRIRRAIEAADRAEDLAPDDPFAAWQRGRALQGWISESQLDGTTIPVDALQSAVDAFDEYVARGGDAPWNARLEIARIVSLWPGRSGEAADVYREAVAAIPADAAPGAREAALRAASDFARRTGDDVLLDWTLTETLEQRPDDVQAWIALSNCQRRLGKPQLAVLERMLETLPTDPEAHAAYARFLISRGQLDRALEHLEQKAGEPDQDAPVLLSAIANTQLAAGRVADAEKTLARLERDFPRHPRTVLERAQIDLRNGSPGRAARALRALAEHAPSEGAYRLLARSEAALGNVDAAVAAIGSAIQASPTLKLEDEMMRLRWLVQLERWRNVVTLIGRLQERTPRTPEQTLMLARARYGTGRPQLGRALLEGLLALPEPPRLAVLEYARREGADPERGDRAYAALEALLERSPNDARALAELCRLDVERGSPDRALARLDAAIDAADRPRPTVYLLRAKLHATAGRTDAAVRDAQQVVRLDPGTPGSSELLATLLVERGDRPAALLTLRTASQDGHLSPAGEVQLGRMYRDMGADLAAVTSFQKALDAGLDEPRLRNDIAYLLAKNRHDLERALEMAKRAREQLDDDPNAVDTLGFVYLQSGSPQEALELFEDAVSRAEPPQADFYYHLGLALETLDRGEEASKAFERALSISTTFPGAADARRGLARDS